MAKAATRADEPREPDPGPAPSDAGLLYEYQVATTTQAPGPALAAFAGGGWRLHTALPGYVDDRDVHKPHGYTFIFERPVTPGAMSRGMASVDLDAEQLRKSAGRRSPGERIDEQRHIRR